MKSRILKKETELRKSYVEALDIIKFTVLLYL
jgi:hypothetical protein